MAPRLILASASPRRRELLGLLGVPFDVQAADVDESPRAGEPPAAYVERLAREKALAIATKAPGALVLAADTSVVVDAEILGKPGASLQEGGRMLRRLSGRAHEVMTAVSLSSWGEGRGEGVVVTTLVRFKPLTAAEISWYLSTGEGQDKAGGYAVQGHAGLFITSLSGSSSNVIGLPLAETVELLLRAGYPLPWSGR
ncbi:MAG: septum formation inhibitor Maf [Myxococcales bacterium]|nr:septum formation inhibitor Maf [Myxococcales bacterium]